MPGARASSAAVFSTAESGSIGEELGQRFMMRLPTMTTAIYRLRPRQMLKMMKGIFAVIVRIQFGFMVLRLKSGLWRTVVWVPGVNRWTSPSALFIGPDRAQLMTNSVKDLWDTLRLRSPRFTATDIQEIQKMLNPLFLLFEPVQSGVSVGESLSLFLQPRNYRVSLKNASWDVKIFSVRSWVYISLNLHQSALQKSVF